MCFAIYQMKKVKKMKSIKHTSFIAIILIIILNFISNLSYSSENSQSNKLKKSFIRRVAVLKFEDHSNFDSPTGCGCLPSWPFNIIFGERSSGEKWDLETGFQYMLFEHINQTDYYQVIPLDELLDAMAVLNLSNKDLRKSEKNRAKFAEKLELDALIVGDITEFGQQRLRGEGASRYAVNGGRIAGINSGISARGYYYSATVETEIIIYGHSGKPLANPKVSSKKRYEVGGAQMAPFEAIISSEGTEVRMGNKTVTKKVTRPIVNQDKLRQMKFGSDEYKKTLLGMVTLEVLDKIIEQLRNSIGPTNKQLESPPNPVNGKIASVDKENPEETYINIGSKDGIAPGHKLAVYRPIDIKDPDTDEVLGATNKKIGLLMVIEVISDRLSRVKIIKGFGEVQKGDIVNEKVGE